MKSINQLTSEIIQAAIDVHRELGPGLLEAAYTTCLEWELSDRGTRFDAQVSVPVFYKGRKVNCGFRADFIVQGVVVIEVKSVESITPVHYAQVLTYLRLTGCPVGLLLNFNSRRLKDGLKRLVHNLPPGEDASGWTTDDQEPPGIEEEAELAKDARSRTPPQTSPARERRVRTE